MTGGLQARHDLARLQVFDLVRVRAADLDEEPVLAGAAGQVVADAVDMNGRVRQDIGPVGATGLATQVVDADVVAAAATPLGQQGGQGADVRIVIGRLADHDGATAAGLERIHAGAAEQDVAAGPAGELVGAGPADQDVVAAAAARVEGVVAAVAEEVRRHG